MGNELSAVEDVEGNLPPLIFVIEQLLWPGLDEVACEVCLHHSEHSNGGGSVIGQISSSSSMAWQPMLVPSTGVKSGLLSMSFYDAQLRLENGGSAHLLTSVKLPFARLVRLGLPLYTSLWLGLKLNELDSNFDAAVGRSRSPNLPKVRVAIFKPCPWSYSDIDGEKTLGSPELTNGGAIMTERGKDLWESLPKPDIQGAFQEDMDRAEGAGCVGRDGHHGITLPQQVQTLIDSLRLSNDSFAELQCSILEKGFQAIRLAKLRIRFEEAFWDAIPDACCVCECGRSGGAPFTQIDTNFLECPNYRVGEPLIISVRRRDSANGDPVLAEQSLECSEFYPKGFSGTISLLAPVPGLPEGQKATAKMSITIVDDAGPQQASALEDRRRLETSAEAEAELETLRAAYMDEKQRFEASSGRVSELESWTQSLEAMHREETQRLEASHNEEKLRMETTYLEEKERMLAEIQRLQASQATPSSLNLALEEQQRNADEEMQRLAAAADAIDKASEAKIAELNLRLQEQRQTADEELQILRVQIASQADSNRHLEASEAKIAELNLLLQEQRQTADEELQILRAQIASQASGRIEEYEARISELQGQLSEAQEDSTRSIEQMQRELEDERKKAYAAAQNEEALRLAVQSAERVCADLQQSNSSLRKELDEISKEHKEGVQQQGGELQRITAEYNERLRQQEVTIAELTQAREETAKQLETQIARADIEKEVQTRKLKAELQVMKDQEEVSKKSLQRVRILESELAEARQAGRSMPATSPDVSRLHYEAELENERRKAAEARQVELDHMKDHLRKQKAEMDDLARRQEDVHQIALTTTRQSWEANLRNLEDRLESAIKLHESTSAQDTPTISALREILLDCTEARLKDPLQIRSLPEEASTSKREQDSFIESIGKFTQAKDPRMMPRTIEEIEAPSQGAGGLRSAGSSVNTLPGSIPESNDFRVWEDMSDAMSSPPTRSPKLSSLDAEERLPPRPHTQGTVRCNQCGALNMIMLDGPPTVQCGSCGFEFLVVGRGSTIGGLAQVAEEAAEGSSDVGVDGSETSETIERKV